MSMGIREKLNRSPGAVAAATAFLFAILAIVAWREFASRDTLSHVAYYSNDDGVTYFKDQVRPLPFQKDGKETVRAMVFTCDRGATTFVGYLMRPASHAEASSTGEAPRLPFAPAATEMEVKKPGGAEWVNVPAGARKPGSDPARDAYDKIMNVKCSGGSGTPMLWNP